MQHFSKLVIFGLLAIASHNVYGQKLEDRILKKAKQRADRKIDKTIDKGLDEVEKGIDDEVSGKKTEKETASKKTKSADTKSREESKSGNENTDQGPSQEPGFSAYTKFDFVPGSVLLFFDDFSADNLGDFPAQWNTNGSGEVVSSADNAAKWFELKPSSLYLPTLQKKLPEDYTMEFDLMTKGISRSTSSTASLQILLDDNTKFTNGKNFAQANVFLTQYINVGVKIRNRINGQQVIDNGLKPDIRKKIIDGTHISIAVTKKRFRLWADEEKVIDIPTLVPAGAIQQVKLSLAGFSGDYKDAHIYIGNFKIAEGGVDLRSKLITEGRLSTTAITFNVNSDKLKPESMGIIKEIAGILESNPEVKIKIIGHTDNDGADGTNLELSKKRSHAVKQALVDFYKISSTRIETDGMGESKPASPNDTPEGKAANRRVEFVKV